MPVVLKGSVSCGNGGGNVPGLGQPIAATVCSLQLEALQREQNGEGEMTYHFCQSVSVPNFERTPGFCDQPICDCRWKIRRSAVDTCDGSEVFLCYCWRGCQLVHHRRYERERRDLVPSRTWVNR